MIYKTTVPSVRPSHHCDINGTLLNLLASPLYVTVVLSFHWTVRSTFLYKKVFKFLIHCRYLNWFDCGVPSAISYFRWLQFFYSSEYMSISAFQQSFVQSDTLVMMYRGTYRLRIIIRWRNVDHEQVFNHLQFLSHMKDPSLL